MNKMTIRACSRCGSLRIRAPSLGEGGVPGSSEIAGMRYCERCRKKVAQIVFDDEKAYRKFLRGMKRKSP